MSIKKIVLSIVFMMVTIFNIHSVSASVTFKDVPTSDPLYKEIYYLANKGVINGYLENGQSSFKPRNSVTRAEVAKMIVVATGNTAKSITASSYSDVSMNVMAGYIERAVELGYMSPTSKGKFSPNVPIKRDEMSKVLATAFKLDVDKTAQLSIPFTDVSASSSYYKYVAALYYNGISNGVSTTSYGLSDSVRRDAFSAFVVRALDKSYQLDLPIQGVTVPSEEDVIARVYVTADDLNVRSQANASSTSIGKVNTGTKLNAYGLENGWVKVAYEGRYAYLSQSFIKFIDTDGMTFNLAKATSNVLATDAVLYRGKSTSTKGITTIKAGQTIKIYGTSDEWSITDYNGIPGYILTSSLKSANTTTPNEQPSSGDNTSDTDHSADNHTQTATTVGKVTVNDLNIRATASGSAAVLGKLNAGNKVDVLSISGWWAKIKSGNTVGYVNKTYLHLMNTTGSSVKNRIIVLDPGHGGTDPGAIKGKIYEKNIVLDVAKRVKSLLEASGAKVILTRSTDTFISLSGRPQIAKNNYADMFISIHTNSATPSALGTETFYNSSYSANLTQEKTLATYINNEIVENANMKDRGIKYGDYAVTRPLEIPAILVELGFISNSSDLKKLTSEQYLQIFAESMYNGIVEYYTYK